MIMDPKMQRLGARGRLAALGLAGALMLLPVIAIRGFGHAAWDPPGHFVFLAILLAGVGIALELAVRVPNGRAFAAAVAIAAAAALLNIWINLAVGIIGSEDDPANWLHAGVLAVAGAGTVLARLRPRGMARAMATAAGAQALAFAVALAAGWGFTGPITVFFMALWLSAAWLFRRSDRAEAGAAVGARRPVVSSPPLR